MDVRESELKDGWRWFMGAGLFALLLCFFLYKADRLLSTSDREQRLGETLRELRTAQFEIAGDRVNGPQGVDSRLLSSADVK